MVLPLPSEKQFSKCVVTEVFTLNKSIQMAQGKINLKVNSQRVAIIDENRFLTRVSRYSTIPSKEVVAYAAQSANVPESAITQAALAVKEAIRYFILNGHHVNLGKFGILGIGISASAAVSSEQVSKDLVKKLKISYRPSTEIAKLIEQVQLNTL